MLQEVCSDEVERGGGGAEGGAAGIPRTGRGLGYLFSPFVRVRVCVKYFTFIDVRYQYVLNGEYPYVFVRVY